MDFWNRRQLQAPPTYTYKAKPNEIDVEYLRSILQDGITFYKQQHLFNLDTSLIARIIYRMKRKFHTAKDFKSLEKVRRLCVIYSKIDISRKLEHLLSLLPENSYKDEIFLPTKNMVDFILVSLQGIGKLLCSTSEMCKRTVELYELRMKFGHFWRIALIAVSLSSRIHILSLNIIKYTCLFHLRLLPFSNHLKNPGVTKWLPKNYTIPKDLKEWLGVNWTETEEIIVEIPEQEDENAPFFDLVEDSDDDDVQFCSNYIQIEDDEELEIFGDFKNIKAKKIEPINFEKSLTMLRGFTSKNIDVGEEINEENTEEQSDLGEVIPTETPEVAEIIEPEIPSKKRKIKLDNTNTPKKKKIKNKIDESVIIIPDSPCLVNSPKRSKRERKREKKNRQNLNKSLLLEKQKENTKVHHFLKTNNITSENVKKFPRSYKKTKKRLLQ